MLLRNILLAFQTPLSLSLDFSYLTGIGAFVQTGAKHVVRDVVAVDFWPSASVMGDQSDASLLQAGVTLSLCQRKHSTAMSWWIHNNIQPIPGQKVLAGGGAAEIRRLSGEDVYTVSSSITGERSCNDIITHSHAFAPSRWWCSRSCRGMSCSCLGGRWGWWMASSSHSARPVSSVW